jgi:3-methyladenine DNA glycosylase Mpg
MELLNGPGKLCRSFGLTVDQNRLDLAGDTIYIEDRLCKVENIGQSRRVGIRVGVERPWRFFDGDSKVISRPR